MKPVDIALREWGARKLEQQVNCWKVDSVYIDRETVTVSFETIYVGGCETCAFDYEGCVITGSTPGGATFSEDFSIDFRDALEELLEIEV